MPHDDVKLVPVNHEVATTIDCLMNCTIDNFNATEVRTKIVAEELIVVAWYVNQPDPLSNLPE
jgi:hypothetical protein